MRKIFTRYWIYFIPVVISVSAWIVVYLLGGTTIYNDAKAHANIPRLVIDNLQPGIAQLGSVWLPLPHLLALPFVWINPLWHSGLAGSLASMGAYIMAVFFTYRTSRTLGFNNVAAILGSAVVALNLNFLYLQSTPLTESLFLGCFAGSIYFMIRYFQTNDIRYLVPLGFLTAAQMLTRYDGWFVAGVQLAILLIFDLAHRKLEFQNVLGRSLLYGFPIFIAGSLWLLYNYLIFGSPLYFALGSYSAKAQQASQFNSTGIITMHDWVISSKAYGLLIGDNIGYLLTTLAVIGLGIFLYRAKQLPALARWLIAGLFIAPIVFNILALYLGITAVNTPGLHWNPTQQYANQWFNVRYGILILPVIGICIAALASRGKYIVGLLVAALLAQTAYIVTTGIITVTDGTVGLSNFRYHDMPDALRNDVRGNDQVLMSFSAYSAVAFDSGLPLKNFIHEGLNQEWKPALRSPQRYNIRWVLMANSSSGEAVHDSLTSSADFHANYHIYQTLESAVLYERNR